MRCGQESFFVKKNASFSFHAPGVDPKYEGYFHAAGMLLLLGLMGFIMFKDIFTIFKG